MPIGKTLLEVLDEGRSMSIWDARDDLVLAGQVVDDLIDRLQLLDELVGADILRHLCCAKYAFECIARQGLEDGGQVLAEVLR